MGLLNRRRSAPGADRGRAASAAPPEPETAPGAGEVIRPDSFSQVPEWATLPPMQLSLPEMPSVVSKHFEDSLTSWQAPHRFLGPLGHSVTDEAPAGVVQGMALTVPTVTAAPPVGPAEHMPLAVPHPAAGESGPRRPQWTTRRLPEPAFEPEPVADLPTELPEAGVAEPTASEPGVAPPPADLVGAEPIATVPSPLTVPLLPPLPSPLVSAATPPEMPLAQLPSALIPSSDASRRPDLAPPLERPAEAPVAGLVGDRPVTSTPEAVPPPTVPAGPGAAPAAPAGLDLPLAVPAPGDATPGPTRRLEGPDSPRPGFPDLTAADVAGVDNPSPPEAPAAPEPPPESARAVPVAPLVGQAPAITSGRLETPPAAGPEPEAPSAPPPLAAPPGARPRAGLGEPMTQLPTTATSWDITRMSRDEQLQASRALIQSQMAAAARNLPPVGALAVPSAPGVVPPAGPALPGAPGPRPPGPLPLAGPDGARPRSSGSGRPHSGPVRAGMDLPVAALEPIGPPSRGVAPDDLPEVGPVQAPLLGSTPMMAPGSDGEAAPATGPPEGQRARTEIGARYGVDLSRVPIDRSPQAASEASRMRARAFTSDVAVVIPPSAGTLESGPGHALLSHELTHVAQRARFGPNLPAEDSAAGQVLEGEALDTEMTLANGHAGRLAATQVSGPPLAATWAGVLAAPASRPIGTGALPLAGPPAPPLDADSLASTIMDRLSGLATPAPAGPEITFSAPLPASAPAAPAAAGPIQRAVESPTPAIDPQSAALAPSMARPSDEDLTNLSRWLYPLIKYRLKGELREDRERAGLLTDHYRRW